MVHHGLSGAEALRSATSIAAEAIGLEDHIGTIAPGRLADLVVVDGDAVAAPELLLDPRRIWLVLQLGEVSRRGRARSRPADLTLVAYLCAAAAPGAICVPTSGGPSGTPQPLTASNPGPAVKPHPGGVDVFSSGGDVSAHRGAQRVAVGPGPVEQGRQEHRGPRRIGHRRRARDQRRPQRRRRARAAVGRGLAQQDQLVVGRPGQCRDIRDDAPGRAAAVRRAHLDGLPARLREQPAHAAARRTAAVAPPAPGAATTRPPGRPPAASLPRPAHAGWTRGS